MFCDTHGSKVSAILRDWQKQVAQRAALRARPTKRIPSERGLESTLVETQLCRGTLSCSAHKPACWSAMARCPRSMKTYARLHEGCTIGHNVLVHHFDPLFTVDFQARLHEVQRGRNITSAHDVRDRHSSRGVPSSSSASIFEVLRDSQILGRYKLKATLADMKTVKNTSNACTHGENSGTCGNTLHTWRTAKMKKLRDIPDLNRSSCSGGWAARQSEEGLVEPDDVADQLWSSWSLLASSSSQSDIQK